MTILFDLDGTLLPMDTDGFVDVYFAALVDYFQDIIPPKVMGQALKAAVRDMMTQTGETNIAVFFRTFHKVAGGDGKAYEARFDRFYAERFDALRGNIQKDPVMLEAFDVLKRGGHQMVLATNPAFPVIAQVKRLSWAGLSADDFCLVTGCDNSTACKPHLAYYEEVLEKVGARPEDCLIIGNDVDDDMVAGKLKMNTFLVTDRLINKSGRAYDGLRGSREELLAFCRELPPCI